MRRVFFTGILLIVLSVSVIGQDPHFSQGNMAPVYTNPAQTGFFDGSYRIGLNYRNQWNAVTTPFVSYLTGIDLHLTRKRQGKNFAGAGMYIIRDKAGDGGYGITAASLSASYFHALSRKEKHYLGLGIAVSPAENSINFDKFHYPNQFDGSQYDPGINHGEQYGREWNYYVDISMGLFWSLTKADDRSYSLGFSMFHINQPDISLLKNQRNLLNIRWSLQGNTNYPIHHDWDLIPYFTFQHQSIHRELMLGGLLKYKKWSTPTLETVIFGGIATRWNDAAIFTAGIEYEYLNLGLSYDVNYSSLRKASYLRGGFELSLQYIFNKPQGILKREVTCPIF